MRNFHSDDQVVLRTATDTWTAGTPVRLNNEVLVPVANATAGQSVPCVRRGEVLLPVGENEEIAQGGTAYWDPTLAALCADTAEGRFAVGTAGITTGGYCPVALAQGTTGAVEVGVEDLEPLVVGQDQYVIPYLIPAGVDGGVEITAPVSSMCVAILAEITAAAVSGTITVAAGAATIATLDASATGPVFAVASFSATPGTSFTVSPSTGVEARVVLLMIPAEAGT